MSLAYISSSYSEYYLSNASSILTQNSLDYIGLQYGTLPYQSDSRVEFIDGSQAFEDVIVLIKSLSGEQRALALVSCLCVYLHASYLSLVDVW